MAQQLSNSQLLESLNGILTPLRLDALRDLASRLPGFSAVSRALLLLLLSPVLSTHRPTFFVTQPQYCPPKKPDSVMMYNGYASVRRAGEFVVASLPHSLVASLLRQTPRAQANSGGCVFWSLEAVARSSSPCQAARCDCRATAAGISVTRWEAFSQISQHGRKNHYDNTSKSVIYARGHAGGVGKRCCSFSPTTAAGTPARAENKAKASSAERRG